MKRISRLVSRGILSLVLIQPVSGLTLGTSETNIDLATLSRPPLAELLAASHPLTGLLPPVLMLEGTPNSSMAVAMVWRSIDHAGSGRFAFSGEDRRVSAPRMTHEDLLGSSPMSVPELLKPDTTLSEPPQLLAGTAGGDAGTAPEAVTVPEPMGRTLFGLGLAVLLLRGKLGQSQAYDQTKPFFRFQGFWWAMTRS